MKRFNEISEDDLAVEMDWFHGKASRERYLMLATSEFIRHEEQIAAILGVEKRMKGT